MLTASAAVPAYINENANHISLNGADWSTLRNQFASRKKGNDNVIKVLHIGDSHIQAEFVTNRLRKLLQDRYGNAGRGLMVPLRLAGTNQSNDYKVTAPKDVTFTQTRLLKLPWPERAGLTGIAAVPQANTVVTWTPVDNGAITKATLLTSEGVTELTFDSPLDSLEIPAKSGVSLYGLIAENGRPGILYSAIGNNGATYNDYLLIKDFAPQTAVFSPNLIVLSMGTNEAFSSMTDTEIEWSVETLYNRLKASNPGAAFLMLLPMECQKNRNHGYRPLSPDYDILQRNAEISALLGRTAQRLGIPTWDFYAVAGGQGSSDKWLEDKLMNRDRIHLLKAGYELQADLLFKALTEQL